jgi:hypothetical protein
MNPVTVLLGALAALTAVFATFWTRAVVVRHATACLQASADTCAGAGTALADDARAPAALQIGIGAVTNFFDSLGIGSFATTTALWRATRSVPDRVIPGTLNAGHTIPVIVQAFIFTSIIPVDIVTLFSMIGAAVAGAWFGAGVVARLPRRKVQIGMGAALLVAATLMLMTQLELFPGGGEALGVRGMPLALAIAGNLVLGALMTLGIGLYAPCDDPGEPARHEPARRVSHHDGVLRVPHAGGRHAVHPRGQLQLARGAGPHARRIAGRAAGGVRGARSCRSTRSGGWSSPWSSTRRAGLLWAALRGAREETKAAEPAVTSGRR